jgi:hypothetical protein
MHAVGRLEPHSGKPDGEVSEFTEIIAKQEALSTLILADIVPYIPVYS